MNSDVDFFFQLRAPHIVETRENRETPLTAAPSNDHHAVSRKVRMSVKKAAKSAVTDIKSKAIGKCTNIGCMGFMPDPKFGSTVFVYENDVTFRLLA